MRKIIVLLMCCFVLGGCGSKDIEINAETTTDSETIKETQKEIQPENLYETEQLVDKTIGDVYYKIPKSWDADSKISENDAYYYDDDNLMIMIQVQDFDWKSYDVFSEKEKDDFAKGITTTFPETFNNYKEVEKGFVDLPGTTAYRLKATGEIAGYEYMDMMMFASNYKSYTFSLFTLKDKIENYKYDFEALLESISIIVKENYNTKTDVINQLKELYKGEAKNKLSYSDENSNSCFEVVLKSSKELAKSVSGFSAEEMVDNVLFNPFATAAGYLCNNYEEDTDYGKVGNKAFELLGFVILGDDENIKKILNEYSEIATKHGMTIVTLEETEKQTEESTQSQTQEPIELSTGNYIVGEDIPAGKYDIIGVESGNVYVSSNGGESADILIETIEPGETVYANVRLKDGYAVEIVLGGKIQLQPK